MSLAAGRFEINMAGQPSRRRSVAAPCIVVTFVGSIENVTAAACPWS